MTGNPDGAGRPLEGRTLGDFVVGKRLGEGGFGVVHRARQLSLDRDAVVKVQHARHRASAPMIERFLREAHMASRLEHPYAAHLYAFGAEPDGLLWIAMELVRGTALDELLRMRGPLPPEMAVPLVEKIAEVVHAAHEQGIIHRDLKPANVVVVAHAGRLLPKLLDFGVARSVAAPEREAGVAPSALAAPLGPGGLTRPDDFFGSPFYMAPEQWVGSSALSARTDIYALGAMTFELLTGTVPFPGESLFEVAAGHAERAVPPLPPALPAGMHAAIARAMAKDPEARYASALALAAELRAGAGLDDGRPALPGLDPSLRDEVLAGFPQPLAEAVAALDAVRSAHHGLAAARAVVAIAARLIALLALAGRSRMGGRAVAGEGGGAERLRRLARDGLADDEWLALARELCAPFTHQPEVFPLPELCALWAAGEPFTKALAACALDGEATASEAAARERFGQALPALAGLLRSLRFLGGYRLAVARADGLESWSGLRREPRARLALRGALPEADRPVLVDGEGGPVLSLWPLAQVGRPSPAAAEELFWLDGHGRHGARLVAHPGGFQRDDGELWTWFAGQFLSAVEEPDPAAGEVRPYPGLAPFAASDAGVFFGREREAEGFLNRLRVQSLLVLVGPSGAGKSSFLAAGVVRDLPPGWRSVGMRPGATPTAALATALRPARREDERLVVIVDQGEELFTLCRDPAERERFAAALIALTEEPGVRVVLALRDDFLAQAQALAALGERIGPALHLIGTPGRADLLRIVTEPARRCGYAFEDDALAAEMVDEVHGAPGALALLAFTAAQLWELRDRHFRRLTRAAYRGLGGVAGALSQHAESLLAAMSAGERAVVREVFRRLVTAEGTRAVRSRAELGQILGAAAGPVLERLVAARLLVVSEGDEGERVEIVHEALLGAWPRLVAWQREDREGARLRDQLGQAARQWSERGRPRGLLWRDEALAEYRLWRARHPGALTEVERDFAAASLRDATRGRRVKAGLLAATVIALGVGLVVMLLLARRADEQRARAEDSSREARRNLEVLHEEQGRQALLTGDAQAALVYLSEALRLGADGAGLRLMLAAASRSIDAELGVLHGHDGRLWWIEQSRDGARVATAGEDGSARLWDGEGRLVAVLAGHEGPVFQARFSPDGARLVTAGRDGVARLWDGHSGAPIARLAGHQGTIHGCAFTTGGERLVTAGADGTARVWDAATGEARTVLAGHRGAVLGVDASERHAVTGAIDGDARLWDLDTGRPIAELAGHRGYVAAVAHGGDRIATAGADGTARLWSPSGEPGPVLAAHTAVVRRVAFSRDRQRLVTASSDRTAKIWDATSGRLLVTLDGHRGALSAAHFDGAGTRVVTASWDGSARIWDTASGTQLATLSGHTSAVLEAGFSADGARVMTAGWDGTARVWHADSRAVLASLPAGAGITYAARFDRSGDRVVTTVAGVARLWDAASGALLRELPGPAAPFLGAAFADDGSRLVVTSLDGTVMLWELPGGRAIAASRAHPGGALYAAFEPGGHRFLTTGKDGAVIVWNGATGEALGRLAGHGAAVWPALFLPGGRILTASEDGTARLWDAGDLRLLHVLAGHGAALDHATASRDGRFIATVSRDKTARLWRADTGEPQAILRGHAGALNTATFSADGAHLVTAGEDGELRLWRRAGGQLVLSVKGHARAVRVIETSPDGAFFATASEDQTARIWDAASLRLLATLEGHAGIVSTLAFDRTGSRLVTAGFDGAAKVWNLGRDARSAAEIRTFVACRVPFHLAEGRLVPGRSGGDCEVPDKGTVRK